MLIIQTQIKTDEKKIIIFFSKSASIVGNLKSDNWISFSMNKEEITQKNWNPNLILESILFKSSKNERIKSIEQKPKVVIHIGFTIFS